MRRSSPRIAASPICTSFPIARVLERRQHVCHSSIGRSSRIAPRVCAVGATLYARHLAGMVGSEQTILVENNGLAHTQNFTLVDAAGLKARALVPVLITGHNGKHLTMQVKQMAAA